MSKYAFIRASGKIVIVSVGKGVPKARSVAHQIKRDPTLEGLRTVDINDGDFPEGAYVDNLEYVEGMGFIDTKEFVLVDWDGLGKGFSELDSEEKSAMGADLLFLHMAAQMQDPVFLLVKFRSFEMNSGDAALVEIVKNILEEGGLVIV